MRFFEILIYVILLAVAMFYQKSFNEKIHNDPTQEFDEPQAIASLGVLGTFLGLAYGLWCFNPTDIESSVPELLSGMRTAFFTSIIGMVWSMGIKYWQNKKEMEYYQQNVKVDNESNIGDLISYLKLRDEKIFEKELSVKRYQEDLLVAIQEINKSLVGDGDSSVITQIQLIKAKIQDGFESRNLQSQNEHKVLVDEFREFTKTMAENNSKAFIEALNSTIRDFNEKVQEQFGENFKQLNVAVSKLLDWQEYYKNTIVEVTENQKNIFSGIEQAKVSLESMANHGDSIKDSAKALGDILVTIDLYQKDLEQSLKDLANIGFEAKELLPNIKSLMEETNLGISNSCEKANKELNVRTMTAIDGATQYYKTIGNELLSSAEMIKSEYNGVTQEIRKTGIAIGTISEQVLRDIKTNGDNIEKLSFKSVQLVDKQMNGIADALNNTISDMIKVISKHENEIDSASSRAIESIKSVSDNLQKSALEVTQRVSDNLTQISKDNNDDLKQQQRNMAKNFEDAMSKALYAFGNEMAKISQKFASDYTPLADRLREILKIAEQTHYRGNRG